MRFNSGRLSATLLFENFYEVKAVIRWSHTIRARFGRAAARLPVGIRRSHVSASSRGTVGVNRRRGFTLVEVVICLLIVMMASIATVAAVTYTRLNMELEKQRLAALNYCRQGMELVQSLRTVHSDTKSLVPFINPEIQDLNADMTIGYYSLNADGSVNWGDKLASPSNERPTFAQVTVSWIPYGSIDRPQSVSMSTILTMGIN